MGRTYPNEIRRVLFLPGGDVGKECRKVALEIAEVAKADARKVYGRHPGDRPRSGKLANSYQVKVIPGTNKFEVINPKKYAAAMEKGARPHQIKARKTTHLQFRDRQGNWRKVTVVNHPGSKARKTLENAMRVVMRRRYSVG